MTGPAQNAHHFGLSLDRFKGLAREQFVLAQKAITLDLLSGLQAGNPVRTGRSRASWTASGGTISTRQVFDPGYVSAKELPAIRAANALSAEASAAAARGIQIVFGEPTFVASNVEYLPHVNDRHPRRAGFFESAIELTRARYALGAPAGLESLA